MRSKAMLAVSLVLALASVAGSAPAASRVYEKSANLDIALRLNNKLRAAGIGVALTRTSDATVALPTRTGLANRLRSDVFVSLHNNANPNPAANWSEVYHQILSTRSRTAGALVSDRLRAYLGTPNKLLTRRGDHGDYYFQLRESRVPAILVESAFLSNPSQARSLATSPAFRDKIAAAVADGLIAYQATLVRTRQAPSLAPGDRSQVDAVPAPRAARGAPVNVTTVRLGWSAPDPDLGGTTRVYRNGALIAELEKGATSFEDPWGAPGRTYGYELRTAVRAGSKILESKPVALRVTMPSFLRVCVDAGHGGSDTGAIGSY